MSSLRADEDLVALVDRLGLLLDPLALAEHVLGRVHEPEADPPLAVELAEVGGGVGQLGHRERVVDVGGLAVAVRVGRLLLVGVEAEAAVHAARQDAVEALLGVAVVALLRSSGVTGGRFERPSIRVSPRPSA